MKDPLLFVVIFFFKAKLPYGHLCCEETSAEESSEVPDAGERQRRGAPWRPPLGLPCHSLSPGLRHPLLAPGWRLLTCALRSALGAPSPQASAQHLWAAFRRRPWSRTHVVFAGNPDALQPLSPLVIALLEEAPAPVVW